MKLLQPKKLSRPELKFNISIYFAGLFFRGGGGCISLRNIIYIYVDLLNSRSGNFKDTLKNFGNCLIRYCVIRYFALTPMQKTPFKNIAIRYVLSLFYYYEIYKSYARPSIVVMNHYT